MYVLATLHAALLPLMFHTLTYSTQPLLQRIISYIVLLYTIYACYFLLSYILFHLLGCSLFVQHNFSVKIRLKLFCQGCHYNFSCSRSSSSNGKLNFPQAEELEWILAIFQGVDTLCCNDSRKNLSATITWHLLCHTRKRIICTS